MSRSQLFIQIHTHYLWKATKLLDDEIEEGSEEDRMDIAQREFNDNECQYQNLYNNIDELFLHDDGRHIAPFQVIRVLDDLTDYIKYTLDIDSVDLNKLEATFALALAFEWAREEPIVMLTDEERDYFTPAVTGQQVVEESSDEEPMVVLTSAELYPQQIHIKGVPQATIDSYCKDNNITRAELQQKIVKGESVKLDLQAEVSPTRWETFLLHVKDFRVIEECRFCGWFSKFPESHLVHAMQSGCQYIEARYDLAAEMERQFS
jgi:hypothetical protein